MPLLHAILLGLVQGLTEFLPVSSSGHLALLPWLFGWDDFGGDGLLEAAFDVALHLVFANKQAHDTYHTHPRHLKFIKENKDRPFFLYVPHLGIHFPWQGPNDPPHRRKGHSYHDDKWGIIPDRSNVRPHVKTMVESLDESVGQIMKALRDNGLDENTLVIFTSDNGGLYHYWKPQEADDVKYYRERSRGSYVKQFEHQGNAHLRGTKADIWEGGHRVPLVVRWPNRIKANATSNQMICLTDVFATCAEVIGAEVPRHGAEDSLSFLPTLLGKASGKPRTTIVNHSNHGEFAYRDGPWKLIYKMSGRNLQQSRGKPTIPKLYNLGNDIAEQNDLSEKRPEVMQQMTKALESLIENGTSRPTQKSSNDTFVRFDTIQTKRWGPTLE